MKNSACEHYCEVLSNELDRNGARGGGEWRSAKCRMASERGEDARGREHYSDGIAGEEGRRGGEGDAGVWREAKGTDQRASDIRIRQYAQNTDAPLWVVVRIHRTNWFAKGSASRDTRNVQILKAPDHLGMESTVHVVSGSLQVLNDGFMNHKQISGGVIGAALVLGA